MTNQEHKNENDILDEFIIEKPKKHKYYTLLSGLSFFLILFIVVSLSFDSSRMTAKKIDWEIAFSVLLLPVTGFIFHLLGKKIGWIINVFYYLLIDILSISIYVKSFITEYDSYQQFNWKTPLMISYVLTITVLLFTKPVRTYFNIRKRLLIIVSGISIAIAALLSFLTLND